MSYTITGGCNGCTACTKICPVEAITGEKKSVHQINSALCIDCGACGRICPEEALTDALGKKCLRIASRALWPKPAFDERLCASCNVCVDGCPVHCLSMRLSGSKDKHERPFMAAAKSCISCGFCQEDCPVGAVSMILPRPEAQTEKNLQVA
jgi:formate hydrogenlyase subunit 6/NADH:ubiquinone oxidoreductase subunit I